MFHCTRCCWMSAPSGCSNRQQSQRERVEQWVFWDLFLCSRSGRYAYHQTADGVIKIQWSKYFPCFSQNPCPGSRLTGGTSCCDNQRWGNSFCTVTTLQYLKSLFPELSHDQITTCTTHYADLGHVHYEKMWVDFVAQMLILSSWPPMFVCHACSLLHGFRANRFKVRGCLLCQEVAAHLFNRQNSAIYLHSMTTISHTISHSMYLNSWAVSIVASYQSAIVDQTPRFNNSEFTDNSSQWFLVITMDPNMKGDLSNTLPQWPPWIEEDGVEMLFNRTEMGVPILELKKTCEGLQKRCEWVLVTFLYWIVVLGFGRVLVQLLDSRRSVRFLVWLNLSCDILSFAKLTSFLASEDSSLSLTTFVFAMREETKWVIDQSSYHLFLVAQNAVKEPRLFTCSLWQLDPLDCLITFIQLSWTHSLIGWALSKYTRVTLSSLDGFAWR